MAKLGEMNKKYVNVFVTHFFPDVFTSAEIIRNVPLFPLRMEMGRNVIDFVR